ncbi:aldehyde dehydrogenase family protein [Deltaproteobacteria bacterium OttesenSCG-928-K17]|nr:aldehyde dehydrogenase family protein [Deltaproteobacteria bacterium OttesenSCG-928-K17]
MSEQSVVDYVAGLVERARKAQKSVENYTQQQVDALVRAVAYELGVKEGVAEELATMALEETGLGDYTSKVAKVRGKARAMLAALKDEKSVGIVEVNKAAGLTRIVKPIGVIASLVPSTQPEMHPLVQAMNVLKARDAIVFSPHPGGRKTTFRTVEILRSVLKANGAPEDLLICAENPTVEMSSEIMRQCDLIMATGGGPMVRAAHSVGKPAYGVGAGNAIMVIDETADLKDAAEKIKISKTFDLAAGCSCDNSLIIHESVYDALIGELKAVGAYLATAEEKAKLQKAIWPNWPADHVLNRKVVAKPVATIAEVAGITVPDGTSFIMVEETEAGGKTPFAGEKMCLVITVYKYKSFDEAIKILNANQAYSGAGHSCGIYSKNDDHIKRLALETYTTRVNINLPNSASNTGNWWNKMPATSSLGCGSWGGNIISENLSLKHYLNNTWLISAIAPVVPTDEELFGELLKK